MEDELQHYGVKGMHWGSRKVTAETAHPDYSPRMRQNDQRIHGKSGVARINQSMFQGKTRDQALKDEAHRTAVKRNIAAGVVIGTYLLSHNGSLLAGSVQVKASENRGKRIVDDLTSATDEHSLKYHKPSRKGVYNITTLK